MFTQSKNWCFTDFELKDWTKIFKGNSDINYVCWGAEVCPDTKRKHYQGWIQVANKKRLGGIKKTCQSKKLHLEACRGTEGQNNKYCQKDNLYKILGECTTQGQRTDLDGLKKIIEDGGTMKNVADANFHAFVQYNRGIQEYKKIIDKSRRKKYAKLEVIHIYGDTGTGKTRKAMSYDENDTYKIQGSAMQWWDGYDGEKTLVIDEYDNQIGCTELLGILDGYSLRLPIKGSFTYANWTRVIITSNYGDLHQNAKEMHRNSLARRITQKILLCADVARGNTETLARNEY